MIETKGLTKIFGGLRSEPFVAVDHIDFEVKRGDVFGFLGPNGAGKTTTIKMLTCTLTPMDGTALVCGHDVRTAPNDVRRNIGLMPERPGFYEEMKAMDLLEFYAKFYKIPERERKRRAKELIEMVGLTPFAWKPSKTFSHGMRKRLALAQALIHEPELLILDEPTGGLDPNGTQEFRNLIMDLNRQGITVFLSSHILPEVQQICNRVCILNHGKVMAVDTIDNLTDTIRARTPSDIEVLGEDFTPAAMEDIRAMQGVTDVDQWEGGMGITVEGEADIVPDIARTLVYEGARIRSITRRQPDLEEIFMSFTREQEEEDD